jgi:hypothetical protein
VGTVKSTASRALAKMRTDSGLREVRTLVGDTDLHRA